MIKPRVTPINEPRPFGPEELFFSLTDSSGHIRYGNRVFTRVSGYDEEQLLGRPHNLIRHPDMPRCVFRLLWDYLEAGKTVAAYVKNLAADGRYYWVLAVVSPCRGGYLSVRLNPSSPLFAAARNLYADVLEFETEVEAKQGKKHAIEKSLDRTLQGLDRAGFASYDEFMQAALKAELTGRNAAFDASRAAEPTGQSDERLDSLRKNLSKTRERLDRIFESLTVFEKLDRELSSKHEALSELGPSLCVLALNADLSASKSARATNVLSSIAKILREKSRDADRLIERLLDQMAPCCSTSRSLCFDIAAARLEAEVCESFVAEISDSEAVETDTHLVESLTVLTASLTERCQSVLRSLHSLWSDTQLMLSSARTLSDCVSMMQVAQLNGRINIATNRDDEGFSTIFAEISAIVRNATEDCREIAELLGATTEGVAPLLAAECSMRMDLCQVDLVSAELAGEMAAC